jgi:hypothetical protein
MARWDDIEFVADDGAPLPSDDDILEVVPRRRPHSLVIVAVVLTLIAGVIVAIGLRHSGHSAVPKAAVPTAAPADVGGVPHIPPADGPVQDGTVTLYDEDPAIDVALAGNRLYVLQTDRLSIIDARNLQVLTSTHLDQSFVAGADQLVLDAWNGRGWIVRTGTASARVVVFDAQSAQVDDVLTVPSPVRQTAVLDSDLFLAGADGVYRLRVGDATASLVHRSATVTSLAADPVRDRLLVLDDRRLLALDAQGRSLAGTAVDVTKGTVAVTGTVIWVAGFGAHGAVLRQVDPTTLRGGSNRAPADQLGRGAIVAAVGDRSLWLRSSSGTPGVLWCRDVTDGPLAAWWTLSGRIASDSGRAFVVNDGMVRSVPLFSGCSG